MSYTWHSREDQLEQADGRVATDKRSLTLQYDYLYVRAALAHADRVDRFGRLSSVNIRYS